MRILIALVAAVFIAGCGGSSEKPAATQKDTATKKVEQPAPPASDSTIGKIVEDMAGATDIKAGRRAQRQLEKIGAQERKDFEDAMSINK